MKNNLSALIAKHIMGWEDNWETPGGISFPHMYGVMDRTEKGPVRATNFPDYADDVEAAFEVEATMQLLQDSSAMLYRYDDRQWAIGYLNWEQIDEIVLGKSPAEVICKYALQQKEILLKENEHEKNSGF